MGTESGSWGLERQEPPRGQCDASVTFQDTPQDLLSRAGCCGGTGCAGVQGLWPFTLGWLLLGMKQDAGPGSGLSQGSLLAGGPGSLRFMGWGPSLEGRGLLISAQG